MASSLNDRRASETSSIKGKMDKLEEFITNFNDQIEVNEASIKQKDENISILESKIKSDEIKLNEYNALIEENKSQIASQELTIRRLEQTIADLNSKLMKLYELYVHIVDYVNESHYARYDNFVIGSKDEDYQLKSLGVYFGDAGDMLRMSEKVNFWVCPKYKNGWWDLKKSNPHCNLNGKFSNTQVNDWHYLYWGLGKWGKGRNHIKSVQMLIRPKADVDKIQC